MNKNSNPPINKDKSNPLINKGNAAINKDNSNPLISNPPINWGEKYNDKNPAIVMAGLNRIRVNPVFRLRQRLRTDK
jgi:hypothetical protein